MKKHDCAWCGQPMPNPPAPQARGEGVDEEFKFRMGRLGKAVRATVREKTKSLEKFRRVPPHDAGTKEREGDEEFNPAPWGNQHEFPTQAQLDAMRDDNASSPSPSVVSEGEPYVTSHECTLENAGYVYPQPQPSVGELIERLVNLAHSDFRVDDPTTGEYFDRDGRDIIAAATTLKQQETDKAQGIAMINELATSLNEARAEIERLERHEQTIRDNGFSLHSELLAAYLVARAEIERLKASFKEILDRTDVDVTTMPEHALLHFVRVVARAALTQGE